MTRLHWLARCAVKILPVIPARQAAVRFPNKPLADLEGRPVVQRLYEAARGRPPLDDAAAKADPNMVKVVRDLAGNALYFSRSPIPHDRGGDDPRCLHHLGLYAFTRETVLRFPTLEPTPLEAFERLEQLRALEHG